jgi:hypothetical protein
MKDVLAAVTFLAMVMAPAVLAMDLFVKRRY